MDIWQVKKDGIVYAYGPGSTFPAADIRKAMRNDGYKIFLNGKLFRQ